MSTKPGSQFRTLLKSALANNSPLNEEFAPGDDELAFSGEVDGGVEDDAPGSIEDIVTGLIDLVDALSAEVFGDPDEDDDLMDDSVAGDDLDGVKVGESCDKGKVLGKKGESLRSKLNRVKGKLNKQGSKANTTLKNAGFTKGPAPKSTFGGKPTSNKVPGQKGTKEDLF